MSVERITPAYDGANTNDSPSAMSATTAPVVDNFLVGRKGKLLMRGPINQVAAGVVNPIIGCWTYDDKLAITTGVKTAGSNGRYPGIGVTSIVSPQTTVFDLTTMTPTAVGVSLSLVGGPHTRLGSFVWGRSAANITPVKIGDTNGPSFPKYVITKWDGTAVVGGFTTLANGPTAFFDIKTHLNRLFVLGGLAADGTDTFVQPNTLFWSDVNGPIVDAVASWQDDVSGLTNRIVLESDDRNDSCIALARLGRSLAVLKRKSIHLLTGSSPANFAIRRVLSGSGCIGQESVVELNDSFIYASDAGLMLYDGASLTNLSADVQAEFLGAALTTNATVRCGRLAGDNILVTVLDTADAVLFSRVLHLPSRSWWGLTSNIMRSGKLLMGDQTATLSWGWDGGSVYALDKALIPESTVATERGFDQSGVTKKRIPARWWSRLAHLALPTNAAAIKRLLLDYAFQVNGGTDADTAWFVSAVTGDGRTILAETQVLAQAASGSAYTYRRQATIDAYAESAHDVQLRVEWKDDGSNTYPALTTAELHDAFVEFQPAQQRQST